MQSALCRAKTNGVSPTRPFSSAGRLLPNSGTAHFLVFLALLCPAALYDLHHAVFRMDGGAADMASLSHLDGQWSCKNERCS